jgi:predicted aldo/keto reductase-like oxidoreductase
LTRRNFIRTTAAAVTGAAFVGQFQLPALAADAKRTATDQVTLGKTGIKLSRLGFGTGIEGSGQKDLGRDGFVSLIRHAYDQGITYIDCAQRYPTFNWIGDAIKGLPREKLFIQSKIWPPADDVLATIDNHRKVFQTDYIDSMLIHCRVEPGWTETWKPMMDAYEQAKERQWIRAKGVSCHSLPALKEATTSNWNEVHLVRINPMGKYMDGQVSEWGPQFTNAVEPVLDQIKLMHEQGRGIIGMKILGNGLFKDPAEREKSIRFAMSNPNIDAVVIGMKTRQEVDEAIERINRALAET